MHVINCSLPADSAAKACSAVSPSVMDSSAQLCSAQLNRAQRSFGGARGAPAIGWEHCVISRLVWGAYRYTTVPASTSADQAAETPAVHQSGGNAIIMPHICTSFKETTGYI